MRAQHLRRHPLSGVPLHLLEPESEDFPLVLHTSKTLGQLSAVEKGEVVRSGVEATGCVTLGKLLNHSGVRFFTIT